MKFYQDTYCEWEGFANFPGVSPEGAQVVDLEDP